MSPETEAFLESVRSAEDPTRADEERVLDAVRATVAAGAVIGTAAATSKLARLWAWSASASVKAGAAVLVLGVAGAVGLAAMHWYRTSSPGGAERVAEAPRARATPPPAAAVHPPAEPALPPAPVPTVAARSPEQRVRPSATASRGASEATVPAPRAASLRAELEVLARAQAALRRGDGAGALTALEAPTSKSPQLAAERATLRILALCALGRRAEAQRAAAALERTEPGSLGRDVISRSCAGGSER